MQVTFDEQYITHAYQPQLVGMLAWHELQQVSLTWFAGQPYWVLIAGSARLTVPRSCEGERDLQDALAQLHNFDAAKARDVLANAESESQVLWRR